MRAGNGPVVDDNDVMNVSSPLPRRTLPPLSLSLNSGARARVHYTVGSRRRDMRAYVDGPTASWRIVV